MSDHSKLLAAIHADLDCDDHRLVYADWLEESGDNQRADCIRLQIEAHRLPSWDPRKVELDQAGWQILRRNRSRWTRICDGVRFSGKDFQRGFLESASVQRCVHLERFLAQNPTVRGLKIRSKECFDQFCKLSSIEQITKLDLRGSWIGAKRTEALVQQPKLQQLTELYVPECGIGQSGLKAICDENHLPNLTHLDISSQRTDIGQDNVSLFPSQKLASLRWLNASDSFATPNSLNELLRDLPSSNLEFLEIGTYNSQMDQDLTPFFSSKALYKLKCLRLWPELSIENFRTLCRQLPSKLLEELNCRFLGEDLSPLEKSLPRFPNLRILGSGLLKPTLPNGDFKQLEFVYGSFVDASFAKRLTKLFNVGVLGENPDWR